MKKENKILIIFSVFIILVFLSGYYLYYSNTLSVSTWIAFISGLSLTTLNFYLGIISVLAALNASDKRFLIIILGGIFFRLVMLLIGVYAGIRLLEIRIDVFIFVIFVSYTIYLVFEIFYFYIIRGRPK
jgi:hypothetical protein